MIAKKFEWRILFNYWLCHWLSSILVNVVCNISQVIPYVNNFLCFFLKKFQCRESQEQETIITLRFSAPLTEATHPEGQLSRGFGK
jgi:hypothetical protein